VVARKGANPTYDWWPLRYGEQDSCVEGAGGDGCFHPKVVVLPYLWRLAQGCCVRNMQSVTSGMSLMKTFASVTDTPCTCEYLQRSADDPDHPIEFDTSVHEFLFVIRADNGSVKTKMLIYHCPFCGGAALASKRGTLFAAIPNAEDARVRAIFANLESIEAVLSKLGPADWDHPNGFSWSMPEREGSPPTRYSGRCLRYKKLSDVANVDVNEHPGGGISVTLGGKYLGSIEPS
jgi:hypothetical protein